MAGLGFTPLHYSFNRYLLCVFYVSGTILVAGDTVVSKADKKNPRPWEADILGVQASAFSRHFAQVSSPRFFPSFSSRVGHLIGVPCQMFLYLLRVISPMLITQAKQLKNHK